MNHRHLANIFRWTLEISLEIAGHRSDGYRMNYIDGLRIVFKPDHQSPLFLSEFSSILLANKHWKICALRYQKWSRKFAKIPSYHPVNLFSLASFTSLSVASCPLQSVFVKQRVVWNSRFRTDPLTHFFCVPYCQKLFPRIFFWRRRCRLQKSHVVHAVDGCENPAPPKGWLKPYQKMEKSLLSTAGFLPSTVSSWLMLVNVGYYIPFFHG